MFVAPHCLRDVFCGAIRGHDTVAHGHYPAVRHCHAHAGQAKDRHSRPAGRRHDLPEVQQTLHSIRLHFRW